MLLPATSGVVEGDAKSSDGLALAIFAHMKLEELKMQILAQHNFIRALLVNVADLAHQRELLSHFDGRVDRVQSPKRLGELVEALTHAVALDMEHEEVAIFGEGSFAPAHTLVS